MRLVWASVSAILSEAPGIQHLAVSSAEDDLGEARGAVCYPALTGSCAPGDRVLLNTTAVDLALGTGGWHYVVAREGAGLAEPAAGRVMKLRYTPLQCDVPVVEEAGSTHEAMARATDLAGMPVICCGLHSQIAPAAAAVMAERPDAKVAYVMTDAASLPMAFSDLARSCVAARIIHATVTTGQAFGGDIEAVTLHSGLLAARHVAGADVAIVGNGPGVTGTDTPFGHGGVVQAQAIDAACALGGRPIAVLRVSFADERERHRGVSHHSAGVLGRLALGRALVAVPRLPSEQAEVLERDLELAGVWGRHDRAVASAELPFVAGVAYRSMGRTERDDPAFFAAAAAAGRVAAHLLAPGR